MDRVTREVTASPPMLLFRAPRMEDGFGVTVRQFGALENEVASGCERD
jgi:hypothetical protein